MASWLEPALAQQLNAGSRRWLVTGSAGFIGSHLLETLLRSGQTVLSLDDFSTGHRHNLEQVRAAVGEEAWARHRFIEGDIGDPAVCADGCQGADIVLHQAALGSVPRSIKDPLTTHRANATGFVNMLVAAKDAGVRRFVYAASSSTYGDSPSLPKVEHVIGRPLSPYAVTKYLNELYADVFGRCYGLGSIGLRYFNVFGPRQDPSSQYAAVVPRFIRAIAEGRQITIHGDGEQSKDFTYVANVIDANVLAGDAAGAAGRVLNVATGGSESVNAVAAAIGRLLGKDVDKVHGPDRPGDVRRSCADVTAAREALGFEPSIGFEDGLRRTIESLVGLEEGS